MKEGVITLKTPSREAGQISALQLTSDPLPMVRVGFIGLGMRGPGAVRRFSYIEGTEIKALCDLEQKNVDKCQDLLKERGLPAADEYIGEEAWKELCRRKDLDLVIISTDWTKHTPMAVYAMNQGKHVAVEVPAAMTIQECWDLVNTCEKTRRHCMMLENCVYDIFEMSTLRMAQEGLFGEVYYGEGGYIHNLAPFWKRYHNNWRLEYNISHNGDNYPTHGFGPLCQVFNIHRGDKMETVVSMDSKSIVGAATAKENVGSDSFAEGDHTISLIRTHKGHVIQIQHNVYANRPYSRLHALTGSKGYAVKYPEQNLCLEPETEALADIEDLKMDKFISKESRDKLIEKYYPDFAKEVRELAKLAGGHGGMDFLMFYRLVYCLHHGLPLDEDVYDAAEWSCLRELSSISINNGNAPVQVPDFTRGDWDKVQGFSYAFAD